MDVDGALARVGVRVPDVLIPRPGSDLHAWAVVACDQFTSQPEYWGQAAAIVDGKPSTLNLIFPEVFLEQPDAAARIRAINTTMTDYLASDVLRTHPRTMVLVRRETAHGVVRWGLMVALDLEHYSWEPDARTPIRATEGTILDRLPPRVAIRRDAPLELPHIMVLISDHHRSVIEPLAAAGERLTPLYDTELMLGGGRVSGWAVDAPDDHATVAAALGDLLDALDPADPLLFAMGDGNHSFATAKSIWNEIRPTLPADQRDDHPARFCLVELENIYDPGLEFEPIHRVLFHCERADFEAALARQCAGYQRVAVATPAEALALIDDPQVQAFGYLDAAGSAVYRLREPRGSLAAATLQRTIDELLADGLAEVDYIHGADVTAELGRTPGNLGLLLPGLSKDSFFASIVADGALPRKTFSLGEASDKRYYLESRHIARKD
ncbi:MAG: DUF1015 domain-containing protein [Micropruina sp.]|uniref:DUF1015 domain-containing protein n=1 Tax=Micropruina sp. TaxID=2737536 RepID=UPI0039E675E7